MLKLSRKRPEVVTSVKKVHNKIKKLQHDTPEMLCNALMELPTMVSLVKI